MTRHLTLSLILLWSSCASAAPLAGKLGLEILGVPDGSIPELTARISAELGMDQNTAYETAKPSGWWFWQREPFDHKVAIRFDRFRAGREKRTLIAGVAARYAYQADAEGVVRVESATGDTLLALVPFHFIWQRPVSYQFPGISPEAASVQLTAARAHPFEAQATKALATEVTRAVRRALRKATGDES